MAGFFGKWFVFKAAMDAGLHGLTIIAFINSVIGAYYYLKVLVFLYMREPAAHAPVAKPMWSGEVVTAIAVSEVSCTTCPKPPPPPPLTASEKAMAFGKKHGFKILKKAASFALEMI